MVRPFALRRKSPSGLYDDPGPPPILGSSGDQQFKDNINQVIRYSSWLDPRDQVEMNISPQVYANNHLDLFEKSFFFRSLTNNFRQIPIWSLFQNIF